MQFHSGRGRAFACVAFGISVIAIGLTSERGDEVPIVRQNVPDWWYRSFIVGVGCVPILIGFLTL